MAVWVGMLFWSGVVGLVGLVDVYCLRFVLVGGVFFEVRFGLHVFFRCSQFLGCLLLFVVAGADSRVGYYGSTS